MVDFRSRQARGEPHQTGAFSQTVCRSFFANCLPAERPQALVFLAAAMDLELGIVCGHCDIYSPMSTLACPGCGHDLSLFPGKSAVADESRPAAAGAFPRPQAKISLGSAGDSGPAHARDDPPADPLAPADDSPDKPQGSLVQSSYARLSERAASWSRPAITYASRVRPRYLRGTSSVVAAEMPFPPTF